MAAQILSKDKSSKTIKVTYPNPSHSNTSKLKTRVLLGKIPSLKEQKQKTHICKISLVGRRPSKASDLTLVRLSPCHPDRCATHALLSSSMREARPLFRLRFGRPVELAQDAAMELWV
ncbi:hypothetical protein L484_005627 [Morus notabilis]|uniref:Uncharacterized protein n=1 Tax=Morus notabilis TaxID=981085 RepID=W9STS7_9ROSA|nr:hypothetical protein L484_005627 [Morus notabilis]